MKRPPDAVSDLALPLRPTPPAWAIDPFVENGIGEERVGAPEVPVMSRRADALTLLRATIANAAGLTSPELVDAVADVYRTCAHELAKQDRHAVRVWNFVPDIQGRLGSGDRYMAFNVGRFAAYNDWFGGPTSFASHLPTASAVGVDADVLSVYVLAANEAGRPVENPRQTPSYNYSRRYGVRPPCFSRATRVGSTLFIGGTASIVGERSRHSDDVEAQTRETCRNIAAVIGAASSQWREDSLRALVSLRVHVRDSHDAPAVRSLLKELAPAVPTVEFVQAVLCRRELLVEIEGVAEC